ncbi:MAG: GAF domain-containing protein [Bacillota bacterium]
MDKSQSYKQIIQALTALLEDEDNLIANLANTAAVLYNNLDDVNWAGFYLRQGEQLVLGPFQGKNACVRIDKGSGVCGTAFASQEIQLVEDVHKFSGHIACDPASNSEIVVPIVVNGIVKAVLDIDSPVIGRFDQLDQDYLVKVVKLLKAETEF